MVKIILASASPRRIELLKQIGIDFSVIPANIDESIEGYLEAGKYSVEMSRRKALAVAESLQGEIEENIFVLGADTVVSVDGIIFGKPTDGSDALRMLKILENGWHKVTTGLTLVKPKNMEVLSEAETTRVKMASYSEGFLSRYLSTKEPYDKAGSYAIQGYGSLMVECIEGCYFNVMGLPIYRLSQMLSRKGYEALSWI